MRVRTNLAVALPTISTSRVQRPSTERAKAKAAIRDGYLRPEFAGLRDRAERAYELLSGEPTDG